MQYEDFQHLLFERLPDGVLLVTLNRPEVMNATNARMHWELTKVWGVVNDDPTVKVVIVTGAGDRAFSAGGDLGMVEDMVGNPEAVAVVMKEAADIVYNMLACDKPIVSAINGTAVGAGLAVALLADVSIMSDTARITDGHARLGVGAGPWRGHHTAGGAGHAFQVHPQLLRNSGRAQDGLRHLLRLCRPCAEGE